MPAFSFLHCADVHLGSPMRGLGRMPRVLQDRLRDAPEQAFSRVIQAAIDHDVAALIIAGDIFDGAERNLRAQVFLRDQLLRLDDAGIQTLIVAGNHDPLGSLGRGILLPPSVRLFGASVERVILRHRGQELAWVFGASYAKAATHENLAGNFPDQPEGPYNIAVLHTNVGDRPGSGPYAPCRLADLTGKGFDYWALGHVHTRETLSACRPVVHYPGNPQALHTGEPGPRGATLVRVGEPGAAELQAIHTDDVRWHRQMTSIEELESIEELVVAYSHIAANLRGSGSDRVHLVRWTLTGSGPLHHELSSTGAQAELAEAVRASEGLRAGSGVVWLERIDMETQPTRDMARLRRQQDYLGDMLQLAERLRESPPVPQGVEGRATEDDLGRVARTALAELLDTPRLVRAFGESPWNLMQWETIVARAEALAVEHLAPMESD